MAENTAVNSSFPNDSKDIREVGEHSHIKLTAGDIIFNILNYLFFGLFTLSCIFPFYYIFINTISNPELVTRGAITLIPKELTIQNYISMGAVGDLWKSVLVTVLRTVIGTVSSTFVTALLAYVLSRKNFIFKKQLSLIYVITMYVSGGLIPVFLVYKALGLTNSFWVYILPGMVSAFNMLVIRTYMNGLPESLSESAEIDGAGHMTIFIKIIFPLCMPVIATVALFTAVGQWNSWFDAMLYNRMSDNLTTLQYELMKLLSAVTTSGKGQTAQTMEHASGMVTPTSVRAAATVITSLPIICLYPFLQKYFVAGLTIGGVKE